MCRPVYVPYFRVLPPREGRLQALLHLDARDGQRGRRGRLQRRLSTGILLPLLQLQVGRFTWLALILCCPNIRGQRLREHDFSSPNHGLLYSKVCAGQFIRETLECSATLAKRSHIPHRAATVRGTFFSHISGGLCGCVASLPQLSCSLFSQPAAL